MSFAQDISCCLVRCLEFIMNKFSFSQGLGSVAVAGAIALSSILPALAETKPAAPKAGATPSPKLSPKPMVTPAAPEPEAAPKAAASSLVGQCRAVNKQTPIFKTRATSAEAVVLLKANDKVTLSENTASEGLIAVSAPKAGFVAVANLKACPGGSGGPSGPPAGGSSCRIVVQSKGLAIRKDPAVSGEVVGGAAFNEKVTLVMPMESKTLEDGRVWVKLEKPSMGWVSEGFKDQAFKNLASCK
jgi:hypothetical protein